MFPGEADAAEDLDAVLGVVHRVVQRQRGGGRGGERVLVGRLVGGAGGVPGQGGGAFGPAGHGGAQVLDRLERADRAAELAADPGVPGRGLAAPGGDACGFGGEQGGGQVADAVRAEAGAETPGRDRHAVEPDGGQVAGEVDRGRLVTVTPGQPASSWNHASPSSVVHPRSRCEVVPAPSTGPAWPVTCNVPSAARVPVSVPAVKPTAPVAWPAARAASSAVVPAAVRSRPARAFGVTGPGTSAMVSCSRAAARSATGAPPAPPGAFPRVSRSRRCRGRRGRSDTCSRPARLGPAQGGAPPRPGQPAWPSRGSTPARPVGPA